MRSGKEQAAARSVAVWLRSVVATAAGTIPVERMSVVASRVAESTTQLILPEAVGAVGEEADLVKEDYWPWREPPCPREVMMKSRSGVSHDCSQETRGAIELLSFEACSLFGSFRFH